jgi:hemerythrin
MALISWGAQYSVAVGSIDKQHQKLFAMLNELHDAMKSGQGKQAVPVILRRLVEYAAEHFACEEGMMRQARYPDYAGHKAQHDKLTAELLQMVQDFESEKNVLSMDLLEFLRKWLQAHIVECDKKYTPHMQAAGVR